METGGDEWSWSVEVPYACACGAYTPVTRWRWVEAEARPALARQLRSHGPLVGTCSGCQQPAAGGGAWLELSPGQQQATLVLAAQQRGEVLEALQSHLTQLRERPGQVRAWLVQPRLAFGTDLPADAADAADAAVAADVASQASMADVRPPAKPVAQAMARPVMATPMIAAPVMATPVSTTPGPGEPVQRALVCDLSLEAGGVTVRATLDDPTLRMWSTATVTARPVLLRGLGYPLLGVRLVTTHLGEPAVIDAVVDVGEAHTSESFMRLAQEFRVQLHLHGDTGEVVRALEAENLARNAAICLESAQAQLGAGEFPPDAYRTARESLAGMSAKQRVEPARQTLVEGSYRHIASPAEALAALERVDQVSRKDNLARLLEVDGLPIGEYEAMRKSVLAAALEFGLVAPARFWRRTLGAEMVRDAADWISRLVTSRSAWVARGDDLTPEQAEQAWRAIADLCQHHEVPAPPELTRILGSTRGDSPGRSGLHVVASEGPRPSAARGPTTITAPGRVPSAPQPAAVSRVPSSPVRVAETRAPEPVRSEPAPAGPRTPGMPRPRRSLQPAVAVSGEIGGGIARPSATARTSEIRPEAVVPETRSVTGGGDPKQRVARVLAILGGAKPGEALPLLAELDDDDLLAVLPPLAEVGGRLVPELLERLESPRRPLRQAAAIVLGLARDRRAIDPLTAQLGTEPSAVWVDIAKALGNFGPRVVGPLCALLRGAAPEEKEALAQRVARTLAELVVSDGDAPGGAGRLAVENLLEVADPSVSSAARRALATLAEVRGEATGVGTGAEDREIRRFSTRAYEAITTPELDADGDIEVVGDD